VLICSRENEVKAMSRRLLLSFLLLLWLSASQAQELVRLDPYLRPAVTLPTLAKLAGVPAETQIPVKVRHRTNRQVLRELGLRLTAEAGSVAVGYIARADLPKLMAHPDVQYVEAPYLLWPQNDVSVSEVGARAVQRDSNLTGRGVLIGIVDTGIDWRHWDFRRPDATGSTRILYLLDFSDPGDVDGDGDLDGSGPYGGTLYTAEQIDRALLGAGSVQEADVVGHGTHVAGTAGGNGLGTGPPFAERAFAGVAPEADLIVIKATRTDGRGILDVDQLHALAFLDSVAEVLGRPYVVNLSVGGHSGAHDGTTLVEQFLDAMFGPGIPGKAAVAAAGNDRDDPIHSSGSFSSSSRTFTIRLEIPDYEAQSGKSNDYVSVEVWYSPKTSLSASVTAPSGKLVGPAKTGFQRWENTSEGFVWIDNASAGPDPRNGDRCLLIQVYDYQEDRPPKKGIWTLRLEGNSGHFDLWLAGSSMEAKLLDHLDNTIKVGIPGTARNVITVGSYITKKDWVDLDGNHLQSTSLRNRMLGDFSLFSSPGPTRDGRLKPEICAPGEVIGSSFSQDAPPGGEHSIFHTGNPSFPNGFILRDGRHAISQGTSMAAPHVSGALALILQRHPQLDAYQLKAMLLSGARQDAYTGATPNEQWGYGKLDVRAALGVQPPPSPQLPTEYALRPPYPNPFRSDLRLLIGQPGLEPVATPPVRIEIFDVLGRRVRFLYEGPWLTGRPLHWDGTDDLGLPLGAGIYFVRARVGDRQFVYKVVRLGVPR
jgi:subtilisin family serine protease